MNEINSIVKVGISDMNVVRPPYQIRTSGLGSCVGVILYDQNVQVAGLAHIMLPDSVLSKSSSINLAKYADTAILELIARLSKVGARKGNLKAKIAGGAQMFQSLSESEMMRIGPRNVEAVKKELTVNRIPLIAEDIGGNNGRTIQFDPQTCMLEIRTVNKGIHLI